MKTIKLITLGALVGTCGFAAAQDAPTASQRPKRELPAAILAKFDKDGDGKLSADEEVALRAEMKAKSDERKAEMLKKYDTNGDGKLDEAERAALMTEMEAKRKELFEKYDANKDGKLDPEEVKAARDAGEKLPMGPGGPGGKGPRPAGNGSRPADGPPPAPPAE